MKIFKPKKPHKRLICDWTDKKKYLIQYWMVKFYVSYGMIVDKVQEGISLEQSNSLDEFISFITQKKLGSK